MSARKSAVKPSDEWRGASGAAWPWCDNCGVRGDLHPDCPLRPAIARIVERGQACA